MTDHAYTGRFCGATFGTKYDFADVCGKNTTYTPAQGDENTGRCVAPDPITCPDPVTCPDVITCDLDSTSQQGNTCVANFLIDDIETQVCGPNTTYVPPQGNEQAGHCVGPDPPPEFVFDPKALLEPVLEPIKKRIKRGYIWNNPFHLKDLKYEDGSVVKDVSINTCIQEARKQNIKFILHASNTFQVPFEKDIPIYSMINDNGVGNLYSKCSEFTGINVNKALGDWFDTGDISTGTFYREENNTTIDLR